MCGIPNRLKAVHAMKSEEKYLDVSAENIDVTIGYTRKRNPGLVLCNLLEENKPPTTDNLQMKEEETTVLCIN